MNGSRAWLEKDFYAVLGVSEGASPDEVKRAYKKLARENHPDRNPGNRAAEERMKDASEAYDVLSDAAKRKEYDDLRRLRRHGYAGGSPGAGWQSNIRFDDLPFDMEDLFGGFASGGARRPRRGADVQSRARIPFVDAINGATVSVKVEGSPVKVKIPAGIEDGARLRVRGRGAAGPAGPGDLYVRVEVEPHPVFTRNGKNLKAEVSVSFAEAALGSTVQVPTLAEPVTVKVPPGTQPGTVLRVRGKGAPGGDLHVQVNVTVPTNLTKQERELIERLAAIRNGRGREAV